MNGQANTDLDSLAKTWLAKLTDAFESSNSNRLADLFVKDGWFQDYLTFSWVFHSCHGQEDIVSYLEKPLKIRSRQVSNIKIDTTFGLTPEPGELPGFQTLSFGITFETQHAWGRGYVRLVPHVDSASDSNEWKALVMMMTVSDWKGYEEKGREEPNGLNGKLWQEVQAERRRNTETEPEVLIIGAGHVGLMIAARLKQHDISALVIEKNDRVGDNWRKRYPSLKLHSPLGQVTLPYSTYPSNWPMFTPKDKMGDWLEQYSIVQDLVVWTASVLVPHPQYDDATGKWSFVINKGGKPVALKATHIVIAMSTFGEGIIPEIPGRDIFKGSEVHSEKYTGGPIYKGRRVAVIGAGNSSADICQDLVLHGATSVTMVQRSDTCVVSHAFAVMQMNQMWPLQYPSFVNDLKVYCMPIGMLREVMRKVQFMVNQFDEDMRKGLEEKGFKISVGKDGSGHVLRGIERAGGFFLDTGVADLIIEDKVKVKQGVELSHLTENTLVLGDGTSLPVDDIIYATGFKPLRDCLRPMLGDEIVERTPEVWGLDENDQLIGSWRPLDVKNLWFAAGEFSISRFHSKHLALYIKASEIGLFKR